jgi:20S proteasome subunit beta 5
MGGAAIDSIDSDTDSGDESSTFRPVMTGKVEFEPVEDNMEEGFISRMGSLLQNSLSSSGGDKDNDTTKFQLASIDDQDLKGRYYYDKFQFTPFDADKHLALRRAYIEGLVWNLKYYYEGCVSWEWYYPYHYGPMLSDLIDLDDILEDISFENKGSPLSPFEQLLGCMPPSQAHHLPEPYRWLMLDPQSPIIDFYPKTFTVDMNGKRWPWEAVVLLPFIDSKRLLDASSTVDVSILSQDERDRNSKGTTVVMMHDPAHEEVVPQIGSLDCFQTILSCNAISVPFELSDWNSLTERTTVLKPLVKDGTQHPLSGYSSLQTAPVQSLWRRKMGLNIFGGRSRYKTASLEMSSLMPPLPPVELLAPKLIGTSVYVNYPHYIEALVTAVSDQNVTARGKSEPRRWSKEEASRWKFQRDGMIRQAEIGEGNPGTGGLILPPDQAITLSVRPLQALAKTKDGTIVKAYAKFELEIPLISTFWSPAQPDQRLLGVPSQLEKNVFEVAMPSASKQRLSQKFKVSKGKGSRHRKLFPAKNGPQKVSSRNSADINGATKITAAYFSTLHSQPMKERRLAAPFVSSSAWEPGSAPLRYSPGFGSVLHESYFEYRRFTTLLTGKTNAHQLHSFSVAGRMDNIRIANPVSSVPRGLSTTTASMYLPKGRLLAVGVFVTSFFMNFVQAAMETTQQLNTGMSYSHMAFASMASPLNVQDKLVPISNIRGGDFQDDSLLPQQRPLPALEFAHGTTTLSFLFQGGIIVAVDSRASLGSFVGSKTVQKVLPVSSHVLGTMAGGAADCQFWIRKVKAEALLHELVEDGKRMSVARVSRILSNYLYNARGYDLSVGTMIAGWDSKGPQIFYVDSTGTRIKGDLFAVGSGSTFALSILDTQMKRHDLSVDEAIQLGIKAIRHATFRDAYSGGFINVFLITPIEGWKKVYTEDIARSPEVWKSLQKANENEKILTSNNKG